MCRVIKMYLNCLKRLYLYFTDSIWRTFSYVYFWLKSATKFLKRKKSKDSMSHLANGTLEYQQQLFIFSTIQRNNWARMDRKYVVQVFSCFPDSYLFTGFLALYILMNKGGLNVLLNYTARTFKLFKYTARKFKNCLKIVQIQKVRIRIRPKTARLRAMYVLFLFLVNMMRLIECWGSVWARGNFFFAFDFHVHNHYISDRVEVEKTTVQSPLEKFFKTFLDLPPPPEKNNIK